MCEHGKYSRMSGFMYYKEENDLFARESSLRYCDLKVVNSFDLFFLGISFFKSKQDFSYRRHCHPAYEIIIPTAGGYRCLLNNQELSVRVGELLLVQEGDWHQDILHPGTEFTIITFAINNPGDGHLDNTNPGNANIKRKLFQDGVTPDDQKIKCPEDEFFTSVFKQLVAAGTAENHSNTFYIMDSLFRALFWKIIFLFPEWQLSATFTRSLGDEAMRRTLFEIFEKHIHGKLNIAEIAAGMNMSRSSLTHKYKTIIGEPPVEAFTRYKLSRLEPFLKDPRATIKEISEMFGFENQFHFSRIFKRFYGISPTKYRKIH